MGDNADRVLSRAVQSSRSRLLCTLHLLSTTTRRRGIKYEAKSGTSQLAVLSYQSFGEINNLLTIINPVAPPSKPLRCTVSAIPAAAKSSADRRSHASRARSASKPFATFSPPTLLPLAPTGGEAEACRIRGRRDKQGRAVSRTTATTLWARVFDTFPDWSLLYERYGTPLNTCKQQKGDDVRKKRGYLAKTTLIWCAHRWNAGVRNSWPRYDCYTQLFPNIPILTTLHG